jgi:hypothetical protein
MQMKRARNLNAARRNITCCVALGAERRGRESGRVEVQVHILHSGNGVCHRGPFGELAAFRVNARSRTSGVATYGSPLLQTLRMNSEGVVGTFFVIVVDDCSLVSTQTQ